MHAGAFMLVYLAMYCWYLHKGFLLLRSRPYNSFRVGNILVRIQVASLIIRALQTSSHEGFGHHKIRDYVGLIEASSIVSMLVATAAEVP